MVKFGDLFWKALILTVVVFLLGVLLGFSLEKNRLGDVEDQYQQFELRWNDAKLRSFYYQNLNPEFCDSAIKENLDFADKIYQEGLKIEDYDEASFLTKGLDIEKKKYALLKIDFWLNSAVLKEKCNSDYKNVVYFFANNPDLDTDAEQKTQSEILKDLKQKYGKEMMLIPIPIDMDISIVNIMKDNYGIKKTPTILVDEKMKLEGLQEFDVLDQIIKNEQL